MNEALVANWNARVAVGDVVYCLGDLFLTRTVEEARTIRARLNGTIRLIRGNHDQIAEQMRGDFECVKDYEEASFDLPSGKKQRVVMFHYPIFSWRGMRGGTIHLHGHAHGATPITIGALRKDVGVDCSGYAPVSLLELASWADAQRLHFDKSEEYPGASPLEVPHGYVVPSDVECFGMRGGVPMFRQKVNMG